MIYNNQTYYTQGRSPSFTRGSLGYPKKYIILKLVGMYLYLATLNNKH